MYYIVSYLIKYNVSKCTNNSNNSTMVGSYWLYLLEYRMIDDKNYELFTTNNI